jgi:hypothetical protein
MAGVAWADPSVARPGHESIRPVGLVLPDRYDLARRLTNAGAVEVGFVWQEWTVAGLPVWRWNGRYCLFMDERFWAVPPAQAATLLGASADDLKPPLGYWLPSGLVAGASLTLLVTLVLLLPTLRRALRWLKQALAQPS